MEKKWLYHSINHTEVAQLQQELNTSKIIASLLVLRRINTYNLAKDFFRPSLNMLHHPFLMKDMDKAVTRIKQAIDANEKVLVFGDYDVDGTTAVALVFDFLKNYTHHINYYIPDRHIEGYGISTQSIDFAYENNFTLIIALDCGIRSVDKILYAKNKHIDYIICDHHLPSETVPNAYAILNPKQTNCSYPFKELSGCGIGFKLIQAIALYLNIQNEVVYNYLDLVATSIAADIVPIVNENRVLAYFGLIQLNTNPRSGLKAILSNQKQKKIDIHTLVFTVAPRINAAGRIYQGNKAVELLLSETTNSKEFSDALNVINIERRDIDLTITQEAIEMIENDSEITNKKAIVLYNPSWHKGVVGIVASRIVEKYYKPTIILTLSNNIITGSARSVKDYNVYEAIDNCSQWLTQYGGHMYAAGLSLVESDFLNFKTDFEQEVFKTISEDQLRLKVDIDLEISFNDINSKLINTLQQFAPFGPQNMSPIFVSKKVKFLNEVNYIQDKHIKLTICQCSTEHITFLAIGFSLASSFKLIEQEAFFDIAYKIEEQYYNNHTYIQLNLVDIKAHLAH